MVGLHSSAIVGSPDEHYVVVANAGSDTLERDRRAHGRSD